MISNLPKNKSSFSAVIERPSIPDPSFLVFALLASFDICYRTIDSQTSLLAVPVTELYSSTFLSALISQTHLCIDMCSRFVFLSNATGGNIHERSTINTSVCAVVFLSEVTNQAFHMSKLYPSIQFPAFDTLDLQDSYLTSIAVIWPISCSLMLL